MLGGSDEPCDPSGESKAPRGEQLNTIFAKEQQRPEEGVRETLHVALSLDQHRGPAHRITLRDDEEFRNRAQNETSQGRDEAPRRSPREGDFGDREYGDHQECAFVEIQCKPHQHPYGCGTRAGVNAAREERQQDGIDR